MAELELDLSKPTVSAFVSTATTPGRDEGILFGPRGEGKTVAALGVMIVHAMQHAEGGHQLPTRWIGATGTFEEHLAKTVPSLEAPVFGGAWVISDGGHIAELVIDGRVYVVLRLTGVQHRADMDKLRSEAHGVWFEEPAPVLSEVEKATGIQERAWLIALSSLRLPSYHRPAIITSNYPDVDHWTWMRFKLRPTPRTFCYEIPPQERTTLDDRRRLDELFGGDPALHARLVQGKPAPVLEGQPVARGFAFDAHVAAGTLPIFEGVPLVMGWDAGHTPTCVIAQPTRGHVYVHAGLSQLNSGLRQVIVEDVKPWLAAWAPWALRGPRTDESPFRHYTDHVMGTFDALDADANPHRLIRTELGGVCHLGAAAWTPRIDPLLALLLRRHVDGTAALQIANTEHTRDLIRALMGRWNYPTTASGSLRTDRPDKNDHPWSDLGDALCYAVGGIAPSRPAPDRRRLAMGQRAVTAFDVLDYQHERRPQVRTGFDW
jgi:hypothetical protein